jgi:bacterioferritin-associated ferredoxin
MILKVLFNSGAVSRAMIVCLCKGVSDRRLISEIRQGARSVRQLQACCGAGTDCRACVRQIREMLQTQGQARDDGEGSSQQGT